MIADDQAGLLRSYHRDARFPDCSTFPGCPASHFKNMKAPEIRLRQSMMTKILSMIEDPLFALPAVGDRVSVDLDVVPKNHRQCTTGRVIADRLKHPNTELEQRQILVKFDRNYIKPSKLVMPAVFPEGIRDLWLHISDPRIRRIEQ